MKWRAATVFHLMEQIDINAIDSLQPWETPDKRKLISIGVIPIEADQSAIPLGNSGVWFRVRISEKKIPTSELALRMKERIEPLEQQQGRKIRGKEKLSIRDDILIDLIQQIPPTHKEIDVMFRDDWLIVYSSSTTLVDYVTSWMRERLGKLPIAPAVANQDLGDIVKSLVRSSHFKLDNCVLGASLTITNGKTKNSTTGVDTIEYWEELLPIIRHAEKVESLEIKWRDMIVKIKHDWSLSGIHIDMSEIENDDPEEDQALRDRADALKHIIDLPRMLKDIAIHAGGLDMRHDKEIMTEEAA